MQTDQSNGYTNQGLAHDSFVFRGKNLPPNRSLNGDEVLPFRDMVEHPLIRQVLDELAERLPEELYYHNLHHTQSVMRSVYDLAVADHCSPRDTLLLVIAAAWHDWGYLKQRERNEPLAAVKVAKAMKVEGGFSDQEIAEVTQAILDTQLVRGKSGIPEQQVRGRLSPWLLDADLASFGQPTFFEDSLKIAHEVLGSKVVGPERLGDPRVHHFLMATQALLDNHQYNTEAAKHILCQQKQVNQERLKQLVAALKDDNKRAIQRFWNELNGFFA